MAREHDSSSRIPPRPGASAGASGATGASASSPVFVRRAVPMRGTAGDPGDALMPGGLRGRKETPSSAAGPDTGAHSPTSGSGESEGTGHEAPEAAGTQKRTVEPAGGDGTAGTASGIGAVRAVGTPKPSTEEAPGATPTASEEAPGATSTASEEAGTASVTPSPSPEQTATLATTGTAGGSLAASAAAAGGDGGAGTHADDEPPGGRPKKPMLAAAAIIGAVLITLPFLVAGQDDRKPEKDQTQNAAGTVLDTERSAVPKVYTSQSPKPSVTPSEKKKQKKQVTVKPSGSPALKPVIAPRPSASASRSKPKAKAKVTAGAPAGTAAAALHSLAQNDPKGRHICYRAFVSGHGWQAAVCDGTMTGTTGQGKKITALNIAVWNVEGSSANAMLHDSASTSGNAKWSPSWTAIVADGNNNYIGSSKNGAPFLTAFAMNVGNGSVCHTAVMNGGGWGPQYCKNSRPDFMFVGTTDNNRWFEAVKLTV